MMYRNIYMKKIITIILYLTLIITCFTGCTDKSKPDPAHPVTLTMWHVYGSQTESPLNRLIDEFNRTVGKDSGITINVVSVTSSSAIDMALAASSNGEPGAEHLPDLFTAYPRVAEIVGENNLLSWDSYFTQDELALFTDSFLAEGYFDGKLLMLPIAKSTEALFINETLFNSFSKDTGYTIKDLKTFNEVFEIARAYYDWTNGQNFMQINDYYNYAYVGMKSYDSEFIKDGALQLNEDAFEKIWIPLAKTAIYGGICLEDGYAASRWKTMEIIANTGSTADILYQPDIVIYGDNTTENITALTLPYPTFTQTSSGAVHRGGGLFALKSSDERKNYAAYIFAKWLTEAENNMDFVTQTGYLPVTDAAFTKLFNNIGMVADSDYQNLYKAVDIMISDYELYSLPLYDNASTIQLNFEKNVKAVLKTARNQYLKRINLGENPEALLNELVNSSLEELKNLSFE